ncbi:MAG: methyltransferase domain-containing protein, partial [Planctomycetes bacterium]|nr:methyltransferase domain-containing protein [Planctomycetota bacterium]
QAGELLAKNARAGESLLDAGCGSGYFFHSIEKLRLEYAGIDASPCLIRIGHEEMPRFGCPASRLSCARIEDLQGKVDHVVCMNVLSNVDNFHRPLERLLSMTTRTLILRESMWDRPSEYSYVADKYLDKGMELYVHVNTYNQSEIAGLGERMGFGVTFLLDERTQGRPEMVIGYPHHWSFVVFEKLK